MLKLEAAAAFVAVAESGSITEAARRMALSKSVISERLSELERGLGTKLLDRTTRKLSITETGRSFYERAKRIMQEVADASAEIAERRGELAGPLRIAAPTSFGILHLGPALYGFLAKHPGIELTLDLDDRFVSIVADGYDAILRHGPVVDDGPVIVRKLASSRRFLVAAPDYLETFGRPETVEDLKRHKGIIYSIRGAADWRFKVSRRLMTVRSQTTLRVNNGILMRDAALAGLGLALLPAYFIQAEIADGRLVSVDVGAEPEGASIYMAFPEDRRGSAKLRALTAWLRDVFGDPPYWEA
ncbi:MULTISPECIES: LysR family transcriptional regulator [unclassified Mesorhizobium]|uniref:LysR family transcriptional regulator n=1 Tax=unclassified Mesorhizobium TaxID=325217 RepID=UPI000FE82D2A|nr:MULTISPECIES: LysR family transcriptional regulator [unclassified Mesorhizobium]RWC83990.1 MAG: LysR family transcriptional regulator [Mesorhizobium sp.]TGT90481.1 LysR family transcriptional regulator [Mesorhizobium sp. M8A.F.Ca.ET.161.01.1.1]TGV43061.1 LysR family transcriptional regulator [Mesorhizobium sp. M8A.F.Ca.ET.142.01.1.1]